MVRMTEPTGLFLKTVCIQAFFWSEVSVLPYMPAVFVSRVSHFALSRGFTVGDPAGVGMCAVMLSRHGVGGAKTRAL